MKTIDRNDKDYLHKSIISKFKKSWVKYNDDIIKDALSKIYNELCCYCESKFNFSWYFEVEHFYPKSMSQYKWYENNFLNLHYSCPKCNRLKSDYCPDWTQNWTKKSTFNILSPNFRLSLINKEFIKPSYNVEEKIIYKWPYLISNPNNNKEERKLVNNTIDLLWLNWDKEKKRMGLLEKRIKVFNNFFNLLETLFILIKDEWGKSKSIPVIFEVLFEMMDNKSHYSTMLIHNFWEEIIILLTKYKNINNVN